MMLEIRRMPIGYAETTKAICDAYRQGFEDCLKETKNALVLLKMQRPIVLVAANAPAGGRNRPKSGRARGE